MKISRYSILVLAVSLLWLPAQAQTSGNSTDQSSAGTQVPAESPWYSSTDEAQSVSLGTGQLISLYPRLDQANGEYNDAGTGYIRRGYKYQLLYGTAVESVYTNTIGGVPSTAGGGTTVTSTGDLYSTSVEPYIGISVPTRTGSVLVQYSGVLNPNDTSSGGPQAFHTAALAAMGAFNGRWFWSASSAGSYGSESARLQGPLSFLVVQSTPVADTTSNAVLLRANNVAFVEDRFGIRWLKSRRDVFSLAAFHTYTGIQGNAVNPFGSHGNAVGSKLEYSRSVTPRFDIRGYGEADTALNGPTCRTYGAGLGMGVKVTHSVSLDVAGGPQWSSANCGSPQSANFAASLVRNFARQDKIYASVNRMFTTLAQLDSRWEDNATVGFSKGIHRLLLTTDAGYLRGTSVVNTIPAYHGYFVAPRVRYRITNAVAFTGGYRTFHGSGGSLVSGNASFAVVGFEFYPAPVRFR